MNIKFNALRPVRFLILAFTCAMLFFANAFPAIAAGVSAPSSPSKGTAPINDILEESENALKAEPRTMEEVIEKANQGPNEVQGGADLDQMKRPDNSNAVTIEERVEEILENVTGRN
ncbi:MAG: hypothetical protein HC881_22995 [Leptolyngbyaceae cyanobacterium SL_7_1]|nr:hypothetical protein [Leptolyngbyaceae cyanobacterium SL_7_1]